ncbi:MAG: polysaccharide export protein [Myxococcales bacterium]|nr:polysaccharide export protein [Myxococcales bacterium]
MEVFGEKTLSGQFQISDAGTIDYPLVGRITVAGLQPPRVAKILRSKLAAGYIKNPQVSVLAKNYQEKKKIIVWGQVRKSGTFSYKANMTVIEAITLAGGLSPLADKGSITLTRLSQGQSKHYRISMSDPNAVAYRLVPGDVIYVPERVF